MTAEEKAKKFAMPKSVAQAADRYYLLMQDRLDLQRKAAEIDAEEKFVKAWIIDNLPMSDATGVAGRVCQVRVVPKLRPELTDADAFFEFVAKNRKHGTFSLLNRALNAKAIGEYWAQKKVVPGVEAVQYKSLSYSRVGEVTDDAKKAAFKGRK